MYIALLIQHQAVPAPERPPPLGPEARGLALGRRGGAALQYELALADLDAFEASREEGVGGEASTLAWLRDLSAILLEPPAVELLRVATTTGAEETET